MVKPTQTIRRQVNELFECIDHFVRLALKGLRELENVILKNAYINNYFSNFDEYVIFHLESNAVFGFDRVVDINGLV